MRTRHVDDQPDRWSRRDALLHSTRPVRAGWSLLLAAIAAAGCGHYDLAPRDPSSACKPGAPPPTSARGPGFPCWPVGLAPNDADVYVVNEAVVPASPDVTWAWLTRADLWPTWFSGAKNVRFERGGPRLDLGTVVSWEMIGATIRVEVTRADGPHVLAWEGGAGGVHAYHAWLLLPEGAGTRVVTVETESGTLPTVVGWYIKGKVHDAHDDWLRALAITAKRGSPP